MSEHTQSESVVEVQSPSFAELCLASVPWYGGLTPEQKTGLEREYAESGVPLAEFVFDLSEYPSYAEFQGESAPETPAPETAPVVDTAQALASANKTLAAFGHACRNATEHNARLGKLAAEYVRQFMAASDKARRSTAVDNLAEEMRLWDERSLAESVETGRKRMRERVNLLLRVNAVVELIGDGRGLPKGDGTGKGRGKRQDDKPLPWGILRELAPLVDETPDGWKIVGGLEEQSKALLAESSTAGLKRPDVVAAVAKLLADQAAAQATAAKAIREQADAEEAARVEAARAVRAEVERKAAEVQALAQQAETAPEESKPAVVEQLNAAKSELLAQQEQLGKAIDSQLAAQTAKLQAVAAEEQTVAKAESAIEKADAKKPRTAPADPNPDGNLLSPADIGKAGTVKDVAEMAVELITSNDNPDAVLEALLRQLKDHNTISKASKRAIDAALTTLARVPAKVA